MAAGIPLDWRERLDPIVDWTQFEATQALVQADREVFVDRVRSSTEFTLAHNVRTREEVDATLAQAARAGARIVKPAADTFYGGFAGYFTDPDGHLWEVAWNPAFEVPD